VGGIVVSHASWRWLFFANLPFAAFAAWRLLALPAGERHPREGRTDIAGQALFAVGTVGALFWLTSGGHRFAWGSPLSLALAGGAAIVLATLYWNERRHPVPFLPMDMLGNRTIGLSVALVLFFSACMFAMIFFLPVYLQLGHRISAAYAGLLLLPMTLGQVIAAMVVGRILRRTGEPHVIPVVGMALSSVALLLLALLPPHMGVVIVLGFSTGLGLGAVMPINQVVVQTAAGRAQLGTAMSMMSLARSTGGAAGAAAFGALIFALLPDANGQALLDHADGLDREQVLRAFHHGFLFASAVAALGAFVAWRIPRTTLWEVQK
jgi:MFS family permease